MVTIETMNSPGVGAAAPARTCGDRGSSRLPRPGRGEGSTGGGTHAFSEDSSSCAMTRARDCPSTCGRRQRVRGRQPPGGRRETSEWPPRCPGPVLTAPPAVPSRHQPGPSAGHTLLPRPPHLRMPSMHRAHSGAASRPWPSNLKQPAASVLGSRPSCFPLRPTRSFPALCLASGPSLGVQPWHLPL